MGGSFVADSNLLECAVCARLNVALALQGACFDGVSKIKEFGCVVILSSRIIPPQKIIATKEKQKMRSH